MIYFLKIISSYKIILISSFIYLINLIYYDHIS